jgi:hypothetical protein
LLQLRRVRAATSPRALVLTPDIVPSPLQLRINQSETPLLLSPTQGGRHRTLTFFGNTFTFQREIEILKIGLNYKF